MDADWFVDPLGRYDGRFFDGERWTERVSVDGVQTIDPDWPPEPADDGDSAEAPIPAEDDGAPAAAAAAEKPTLDDAPRSETEPAVAAVAATSARRASLLEESPARTVAVLDRAPAELSPRAMRRRWVGLVAIVAGLALAAVVIVPLLGGDDEDSVSEAPQVDIGSGASDAEVEAVVEGVDESAAAEPLEVDAPEGLVAPGAQFDPAEIVEVGALRIVNGASVLSDLAEWHREYAADRGVDLPDGASCWFGRLGDAAVQTAQCGPVGGSEETELVYDLVPLVFDPADDGQVAQPVVDATVPDSVLANALELVGSADGPAPPPSGIARGERSGG